MTWRERWQALRENPEHRAYVLAEEAKHALALNVYTLRKQRGLSQAELAELVGTKQPNISDIETADANPTLETLGKLAAALEVTVVELLAERGGGPASRAGGGARTVSGPRRLEAAVYVAEGFAGFDFTQGLVFRSAKEVGLTGETYPVSSGRAWS